MSEMTSFLDAVVQRRDAGKLTVLPFASAAASLGGATVTESTPGILTIGV